MSKVKLITTLSLTVVILVAMTGLVIGYGGNIGPTDIGGSTETMFDAGDKVYATGAGIPDHDGDGYVDVYVTDDTSWADGDVISSKTVWITISGVTPDQIANTIYLGDVSNGVGGIPYPASGTYAYDIVVDNDGDGVYETGSTDEDIVNDVPFGCKAFETKIPEFSTIAIPLVSIIGLVLFFNHRKRKKE